MHRRPPCREIESRRDLAAEGAQVLLDQLRREGRLAGVVLEGGPQMTPHLADRELDRGASDRCRFCGGHDHVDQIALDDAAVAEDELGDQVIGHRSRREVRTALEPVTRIGVQAVAPRGPADGGGIEPGRFDEDVAGFGRDHGAPPAHDPGQRQRLSLIRDDQIVRREDPLRAVQQFEALAGARQPDHDAAFDRVQVKGVGGMPHAEQREVGGVDGV